MNFTSPLFLFFLLLLLFLRWLIYPVFSKVTVAFFPKKTFSRSEERRALASPKIANFFLITLLLIGSYFFYATWNYKFLGLLFFTSFSDFILGIKIFSLKSQPKRQFFLFISIFLNLSILGFYKYFFFISENLSNVSGLFGFYIPRPDWQILLPAGISFYTFQSLSYTIDVYRGIIPAEKNFLRYALFLAFFPQLVAGPIVVARDFLPQIMSIYKTKFSEINLNRAFYFILLGFIKKSVIADNISVIPDFVFSDSSNFHNLSWGYIVIGMFSYSLQIYGDFSGYTDIARGVAILFGFHLPENFNMPYLASSLTDFWRRWHISLSTWLRSYLYIPLGGNRFGDLFTYRNLFLTMLLGGIWHGASWNFAIWGGLHGVYLGIERYFRYKFPKYIFSDVRPLFKNVAKIFYSFFVFCLVTCLWVFFRSPNFAFAISMFKSVFHLQSGITANYSVEILFYSIAFFVVSSHLIGFFFTSKIEEFLDKEKGNLHFSFYAFVTILAVLYSGELKPFIYFVF